MIRFGLVSLFSSISTSIDPSLLWCCLTQSWVGISGSLPFPRLLQSERNWATEDRDYYNVAVQDVSDSATGTPST